MEETDKSKTFPKPIGYELKQKRSAIMKLSSLLPCTSCSLISSETSSDTDDEKPLNGFEWQNCETKKEIDKINMLYDIIGHDLKDDSVTSMCNWLLSDEKTHTDPLEPSFASTDGSLEAQEQSVKQEIWTPFSDNRLEIAVTEALNFQLKDHTFTPSTASIDASMITESMACDYEWIILIASKSDDTISSGTDESETVFVDTQITTMPAEMHETQTQQTHQLAVSDNITEANMERCTINEERFIWNPDAPSFIPRNLAHNCKTESLQNHPLTLYDIGTRDALILYRSSYMQSLDLIDQQSLFNQNVMPNVYAGSPQIFSYGLANAYSIVMPVYYNTSIIQIAAGMTNAVSNLIGSHRMHSNVNANEYSTSMIAYCNTPIRQTILNIASAMTNATNSLIESQQIEIMPMNGYSIMMSTYYNTLRYLFIVPGQSDIAMTYNQLSVIHPFIYGIINSI